MKKVLFVSVHLPSKLSGFRILYYDVLRFSEAFDVHFIRLNLNEGNRRLQTGTVVDKDLLELPKNVKFTEIRCDGERFDPLFLAYPIFMKQMSRMAWAMPQVQKYINENKIDCVVLFTGSCCVALRNLVAPVKIAEPLDSTELYYIAKAEHMPSMKNKIIRQLSRVFSGMVLPDLAKKFDLFVYVTDEDRRQDGIPEKKAFIFPHARDQPFKETGTGKRDIDVILSGFWTHPPNRDGLREIAPRLGEIKGKVAIIGINIDKSLEFPPNVKSLGFVENASEYYLRSKIALIPVFYGAGLQSKVFDALRHGCKVVSTSFTKRKFEACGFFSKSAIYSDDLIKATNDALEKYGKKDADAAFQSYREWYDRNSKKEAQFLDAVNRIFMEKGLP
jgi:glycosyltransferase involved in cell wall biosynthesis